jgi:RNA recognition motif-containing protein
MGVEIYVGQISGGVTEDELHKLFSVAGTVTSIHLVKEPGTGSFRGCGYVRMSTEEEARESIDLLNGAMLGGRVIVVRESVKKNESKSGPWVGKQGGTGSQRSRGRK